MLAALGFLTPFGRARTPDTRSFLWFPVIGAAIGGLLGGLWWGLSHVWPPVVTAGLVVVADLAITGLLHFDGVVDAADGLLPPHVDRTRRLEVMRDPSAGAFGAVVAAGVLLLRWASLSALHPSILLAVGIWAASRSLMPIVAMCVPYARSTGGLVSAFLDSGSDQRVAQPSTRITIWAVSVAGITVSILACLGWRVVGGAAVVGSECAAAGLVVWFAYRRIGGFTGDALGAAAVIGETVALLVASARW